MTEDKLRQLARENGISLTGDITFNEIGLDFQIAFASDQNGSSWVFRLPRRSNMFAQIKHEEKILGLMKKKLQIAVPDWRIITPELIAYPLLPDKPALSIEPTTHELTWNIEQTSELFVNSLAQVLAELHAIPPADAMSAGLEIQSPAEVRKKLSDDIDTVIAELGINRQLELQLRRWLDEDRLWPDFSTVVHGDLYAGHILAKPTGGVTGIIDWSEAEVNDPSLDFSGHLAVFGEDSLKLLINAYEKNGGRIWAGVIDQIRARNSASPLKFAVFALKSGLDEHLATAKSLLL